MFVFRVSSAFVIVVLLVKSGLFVADDSKFLEVEALGAIEKSVGKLIDESMRDLSEEKEREEEGASLHFAVTYVRTRKAIMRCVDGVCAWVRRGAEVAHRVISSTSGIGRGDSASAEHYLPLPIEKNEQDFYQPTAGLTTL